MHTLEELLALANAGQLNSADLYNRLVVDPDLTSDDLSKAAQCVDWYVRYLVAQHPNVSVQTVIGLSQDPLASVRMSAVATERVPPTVLMGLLNDEDDGVRQGVAGHPNTPTEGLSVLAKDLDPDVRWCVAGNTSTLLEDLIVLAEDISSDAQNAVAENPSTPPAMKLWLTSDYKHSMTLREFLKQTQTEVQ